MNSINDFEQVGINLYRKDNKYYRLFGKDITPNRCWIISPEMRELKDIETKTGK